MYVLTLPPPPTRTWLCCRQCRTFYTREHPCLCRSDDEGPARVQDRLRGVNVLQTMLRRFWGYCIDGR